MSHCFGPSADRRRLRDAAVYLEQNLGSLQRRDDGARNSPRNATSKKALVKHSSVIGLVCRARTIVGVFHDDVFGRQGQLVDDLTDATPSIK